MIEVNNGQTLSIVVKNNLAELDNLCSALEEFCRKLGLPGKATFPIKLSVEEIFVNIISYGYTDCLEHLIKIDISNQGGTLTIQIEDDGIPFNPLETDPPDLEAPLEDRSTGGLGLHLTKHLMDSICYSRCHGVNHLVMQKRLPQGRCAE
jgi:serine/threonine-protein kinase RsbW